jgi:hypothetical protein
MGRLLGRRGFLRYYTKRLATGHSIVVAGLVLGGEAVEKPAKNNDLNTTYLSQRVVVSQKLSRKGAKSAKEFLTLFHIFLCELCAFARNMSSPQSLPALSVSAVILSLSQLGNAHKISRSNADVACERVVAADHDGAKVLPRLGAGHDDLVAVQLAGLRQQLAGGKTQVDSPAGGLQAEDPAKVERGFLARGAGTLS